MFPKVQVARIRIVLADQTLPPAVKALASHVVPPGTETISAGDLFEKTRELGARQLEELQRHLELWSLSQERGMALYGDVRRSVPLSRRRLAQDLERVVEEVAAEASFSAPELEPLKARIAEVIARSARGPTVDGSRQLHEITAPPLAGLAQANSLLEGRWLPWRSGFDAAEALQRNRIWLAVLGRFLERLSHGRLASQLGPELRDELLRAGAALARQDLAVDRVPGGMEDRRSESVEELSQQQVIDATHAANRLTRALLQTLDEGGLGGSPQSG